MLGRKVTLFSDVARYVVSSGHEVGSHSYNHLNAWSKNPLRVIKDIQEGFEICVQLGPCEYFRPPNGKLTLATLLYVWIANHKLGWWTIDSTDSCIDPLPIEKIIERVRNEGGGVILMHDHDRKNPLKHDYVVNLTCRLIQFAREEGYKICTLKDLQQGALT